MVAFAGQNAGSNLIIRTHRQRPAPDAHFVPRGHIGLPWIIRGEYAVRLMKWAVEIPVPRSPADVGQQDDFEEGVAPHSSTVAQNSALFRDPGRNSSATGRLHGAAGPRARRTRRGVGAILDPKRSGGLLRPDLAPAACRYALAHEDIAAPAGVARLALELCTGAAFLVRFVRCIRLGIDLGGVGHV